MACRAALRVGRCHVVAAAPRVLHPTAVACAPDGRVFVCEDYMDMPGPVDRPVNRILCVHPGGRITVFADQIYVAFNMEYIDGKLYVHHCPRLSVFVDGGNASAGRTDLITTTNPAPWGSSSRGNNQINDHIPAGMQLAMDGYLYIAVGDKGIHGFVGRDGRRLEVPAWARSSACGRTGPPAPRSSRPGSAPSSTRRSTFGMRFFLYDNVVNDHLNIYKTALGYIADGGYYGYPWDARPPRPDYVLPMDVRIYEAGAPTSVLAYEEDALPEVYRGNLFLCDWGRGELVRLGLERRGAGYGTASEQKLLAGNLRPTGIAVAPDGRSLYVGDWQFPGWRNDAKAGRLLKLTYQGASAATPKPAWFIPAAMGREFRASTDELISGLSHSARSVRMVAQRRLAERGAEAVPNLVTLLGDFNAPRHARWHAIWTLDAIDGGLAGRAAILDAVGDRDTSVQAQAIRQLGTRGAAEAGERLAAQLHDADAAIRMQAATALGRIGAAGKVESLRDRLGDDDRLVRHAAITALNRIGRAAPAAWGDIVKGLASDRPLVREGTRLAFRETYDAALVAALARSASQATLPAAARAMAYQVLFELHRMPAEWDGLWWRLGPLGFFEDARNANVRPPKTREWAGTPAVTAALHTWPKRYRTTCSSSRRRERRQARLDRETVDQLLRLFTDAAAADDRPAILAALGSARDPRAAAPALAVLRDPTENVELLLPAIAAARQKGGRTEVFAARQSRGGLTSRRIAPLIAALSAIGELKVAAAVPAARARLNHSAVEVRAAAAGALGQLGGDQATDALISALGDVDLGVRRLAVNALGAMRAKVAVPRLVEAYGKA